MARSVSDALIIDAVRTPRGKGKVGGAISGVHPQRLYAQVLNGLRERVGLNPALVEDVVTGCAVAVGDHGDCIGRLAVLDAGWPVEVPGITLNRFCGSGQQAVNYAAMAVGSGQADVMIGGGVEMMSRYPTEVGRFTLDGGHQHLRDQHPVVPQGISGDLIATLMGATREDVDELAVSSQERAAVAIAEGRFDRSIIPVVDDSGAVLLERDELPRQTNLSKLGMLEPSFARFGSMVIDGYDRSFDEMCRQRYPDIDRVQHVHHAGNSSGLADGASAVLIASAEAAAANGWTARARVAATAVAAAEPVIMLTAPAPATRLCLKRAGMTLDDVDLIEVNEAFSAVVLRFLQDLDLDRARVNVNGGAMALGHPIGATGPILLMTLLDELERRDASVGLVTMCTGGGMATATIIERI